MMCKFIKIAIRINLHRKMVLFDRRRCQTNGITADPHFIFNNAPRAIPLNFSSAPTHMQQQRTRTFRVSISFSLSLCVRQVLYTAFTTANSNGFDSKCENNISVKIRANGDQFKLFDVLFHRVFACKNKSNFRNCLCRLESKQKPNAKA